MVEVPSFLNVNDFFGTVLPGYIAVILYVFIFRPEILQNSDHFDILSPIIFLVAGPAVGLTIKQVQRAFLAMIYMVRYGKKNDYIAFCTKYTKSRTDPNTSLNLNEVDRVESHYDFAASTFIVLLIIGVFSFSPQAIVSHIIQIIIFITAGIMLFMAVIEYVTSLGPTMGSIK